MDFGEPSDDEVDAGKVSSKVSPLGLELICPQTVSRNSGKLYSCVWIAVHSSLANSRSRYLTFTSLAVPRYVPCVYSVSFTMVVRSIVCCWHHKLGVCVV